VIDPSRIIVVTSAGLAAAFRDQLGLGDSNVLVEPTAQSTGPALTWATHEIHRRDPAAVILSLHADWHLPDHAAFRRVADAALSVSEREPFLVTVGVVPSRPDPGFGYIVPGPSFDGGRRVARFIEKPGIAEAAELIAAGALWNSGLFAWRATTLLEQVVAVCPELAGGLPDLDRGDVAGFFRRSGSIAIDRAVLERSGEVAVIPGTFPWDDIGTWESLARVRSTDPAGNVLIGDVFVADSTGVIGWSDSTPIVIAGLSDIVVVAANGRVLVMDRRRAADLKSVLERLPAGVRDL
jgi:mannose-1-phosphate guanylyltransferase